MIFYCTHHQVEAYHQHSFDCTFHETDDEKRVFVVQFGIE